MASYPEGSTELTCRALLDHPRFDKHSRIAVIFDAIVKGRGIANGNPVLYCSFRYVKKEAGESIDGGIYDIVVRVSTRASIFFGAITTYFRKIACFQVGKHEPSPTRLAGDFSLMGDIMLVRAPHCSCTHNHEQLQQLYPVPVTISHAPNMLDMPIHVSVSGIVNDVHSDIHTFTMIISQPLSGVTDAHLCIRGVLGLNVNRSLPLPSCGAVIYFSGVLLAFEERVIQVAIERISFLPSPRPLFATPPLVGHIRGDDHE